MGTGKVAPPPPDYAEFFLAKRKDYLLIFEGVQVPLKGFTLEEAVDYVGSFPNVLMVLEK